jgi:hypothetical protein
MLSGSSSTASPDAHQAFVGDIAVANDFIDRKRRLRTQRPTSV